MKCQFRGCDRDATHAALCCRSVAGFFCFEHAARMVETNWLAKIERVQGKLSEFEFCQ